MATGREEQGVRCGSLVWAHGWVAAPSTEKWPRGGRCRGHVWTGRIWYGTSRARSRVDPGLRGGVWLEIWGTPGTETELSSPGPRVK